MTEAEWLRCQIPIPFLEYARDHFSERKWRLLLCAASYRAWDFLSPDSRMALPVLERYADGEADTIELDTAQRAVPDTLRCAEDEGVFFACEREWVTAKEAVYGVAGKEIIYGWPGRNEGNDKGLDREWTVVANHARDIFGNPFRPVTFSPSWRTDTALILARQMYESRDFSAMPILADALQDAGCDSADIFDHCRGLGPHVRGCWVCDLVLGKE